MKNSKLILTAMICFLITLRAVPLNACTNILVSRGASSDSSTMITYAADSHELYGELYYFPEKDYEEDAMIDIYEWDTGKYLGEIDQVSHTCRVVGNMNEHQVVISETTFTGRTELQDTTGIIDYGSLMYITLQRAKSAREAIQIMDELVSQYGYYSTGESFSIADPNEVWIMEMIGKGPGNKGAVWVARKVPEGYIAAHANQARITSFPLDDPENCLHSEDVISFAREKGYFDGKDEDFDFTAAYAPIDFGGLRFCESRVWSVFRRVTDNMEQYRKYAMGDTTQPRMPLWVKATNKVSVYDVMELMRDHFEGTPMDMTRDIGAGPYQRPYRWRPLVWEHEGKEYFNERAISTQQTGFSFVSQSRNYLPDEIGGILWFGVDDTYSTCYVPMYSSIRNPPHHFAVGTGSFHEFSWESAFWVFNFVSNYAYKRYTDMILDVRQVQKKLEKKFFTYQPAIEKAAIELYRADPEFARDYLTDYSHKQTKMVLDEWKSLGEHLIYKYLDGNPKDENGNVTHPPYPDFWYEEIIEGTGDFFEMK